MTKPLRPSKNKDLVLNIPIVLSAMTGVAQARQDDTMRITLIYTDGSKESMPSKKLLSEDINFFELVRQVQDYARQSATPDTKR